MGKTVKMSFEGKSQQEKWQMDGILKILKKQNSPRASSAPALELNTIIFKHVFGISSRSQVSGYRTIGPLVTFCTPGLVLGFSVVNNRNILLSLYLFLFIFQPQQSCTKCKKIKHLRKICAY